MRIGQLSLSHDTLTGWQLQLDAVGQDGQEEQIQILSHKIREQI